jgi:hypothetical protein
VQTHVFVLHHHPLRLRQRGRHVELLPEVHRRCRQARPKVDLLAVRRNRQAVGRADVHTGIALDAQLVREVRLHVAVQAALDLARGLFGGKAQFDFDVQPLEPRLEVGVHHLLALHRRVVVAVLPVVHAELRAGQRHSHRRSFGDRFALGMLVDGDRGLVPVLHRPDDVFRSPRRVATEKDAGSCRHERRFVDGRHVPLVELDARVTFDPGKAVFLADGENDVVARKHDRVDDFTLLLPAFLVPAKALEFHAGQLAVFDDEPLWRVILDDVDLLLFGILQVPRRRLEVLARPAGHDRHVLAAHPLGCTAAVHGRVADADDQHLLADLLDVAEVDVGEPLDTYMDAIGLVAAGQVEFLPLRRAAADEDGVKALVEKRLHARHRRVVADVHPHVDDHRYFFIQYRRRQAEGRNVHAHQAAGRCVLLEDHALVA